MYSEDCEQTPTVLQELQANPVDAKIVTKHSLVLE